MSKKPLNIFLSHAASDRDAAQKIAEHLREAGYRVWNPENEILPGADWNAEIKVALDSAEAVVILISPEAMESRWVSHEIGYVLGEKRFRGRFIPVLMRPTKDAPWILDSLQSVRYEGSGKTGQQIVELLSQPADAPQTKTRSH